MTSSSSAPTGAPASPVRRDTTTCWMLLSRSVRLASDAAMATDAPSSVKVTAWSRSNTSSLSPLRSTTGVQGCSSVVLADTDRGSPPVSAPSITVTVMVRVPAEAKPLVFSYTTDLIAASYCACVPVPRKVTLPVPLPATTR